MRRARATARHAPLVLAALVLAALATLTAAPAAADDDPPHANRRLDRISAALAKDPLFVDPDLSHAFDEAERARVRQAIRLTARSLGVPVYVVVVPNPTESESQGKDDVFLFKLRERVGDGLYLMGTGRGYLESEGFGVPRRYEYSVLDDDEDNPGPGAWRPADYDHPFDDLAKRMAERMNNFVTAPSAPPSEPRLYATTAPFGKEHTFSPAEPEYSGPFFTGFLVVGPVAGALLYWAGLGLVALRGRGTGGRTRGPRPVRRSRPSHKAAWTKPSMRRLRKEAAKEVEALRGALVTAEAARGRDYAVSAYDAAQILYDEAKEDEERAADLVGAIVLARQGQTALALNVPVPPAPCGVNPLHGDSMTRSRLSRLNHSVLPKPCPLCAVCAGVEEREGLADRHLLVIPHPGGGRPHTDVRGVWRDTAWGANGKNFPSRVMRYLGVE